MRFGFRTRSKEAMMEEYVAQDRTTALSLEFTRPMKVVAWVLVALFVSAIWWMIAPAPEAGWYPMYIVGSLALVFLAYEFFRAYGKEILYTLKLLAYLPVYMGAMLTGFLYIHMKVWGLLVAVVLIWLGFAALTTSILQTSGLNLWHIVALYPLVCAMIGTVFSILFVVQKRLYF